MRFAGIKELKHQTMDLIKVRSALILKGSSLEQWCREHGYCSGFAHRSIMGERNGPLSQKLRRELLEELGW